MRNIYTTTEIQTSDEALAHSDRGARRHSGPFSKSDAGRQRRADRRRVRSLKVGF